MICSDSKYIRRIKRFDFLLEECKKIHSGRYDFSKASSVEFKNTNSKIKLFCYKSGHGYFLRSFIDLMKGCGCPKCGRERILQSHLYSFEKFLGLAKDKYGDRFSYIQPDKDFHFNTDFINLKCNECGSNFKVKAKNHIHYRKGGCRNCQYKKNAEKRTIPVEKIQKKIDSIFPGKGFKVNIDKYVKASDKVFVVCPGHGEYSTRGINFANGYGGCPKCYKPSILENVIKEILEKRNIKYTVNDRSIITPAEIDFFLPDYDIAIEACGLYWHSEEYLDKNYHLDKLEKCNKAKVQLFQFFEDEIKNSPHLIESMILGAVGRNSRIFARKCKIKEVSAKEVNEFFAVNHIQKGCNTPINIGLFYGSNMVACMSFVGLRKSLGSGAKDGHYELARFANLVGFHVIGGASKLFSHFIKKHKPKSVISYCNLRYSKGNMYEKIGFEKISQTTPNYFYFESGRGDVRYNRFKFRKSQLSKVLPEYDNNKSERENMLNAGYLRIYDCGNIKYKWENKVAS